MKTRFVVLIAVACMLLGVGFGASMQPKPEGRPHPQVTHRLIDTHMLSQFLDCYCHNMSIQKDAIAAYTTCELQIARTNGQVQTLWRDSKFEFDEDGTYRVVVMMKPSDRSKTFNTSLGVDIYCNGITQKGIVNPFRDLLQDKGIAFVQSGKLTDGQLKLYEWDGKTETDPKAVIRLAFK